MPRRPVAKDVVERWKTFLHNHREGIVGMDFFTVPTATRCQRWAFTHGSMIAKPRVWPSWMRF